MRNFACLAVLLCACGSSKDHGNATATGTYQNKPFVLAGAAIIDNGKTYLHIILTEKADGTCGGSQLELLLSQDGRTARDPGVYTFDSSSISFRNLAAVNAGVTDCAKSNNVSAAPGQGTVTLTDVSLTQASGSFEIKLDSTNHIAGTFRAARLDYLLEGF